jgi:hypothetical protein
MRAPQILRHGDAWLPVFRAIAVVFRVTEIGLPAEEGEEE